MKTKNERDPTPIDAPNSPTLPDPADDFSVDAPSMDTGPESGSTD
jgi:hypothetical protein